ncbi:type IV pilus secretin PilQ [Acidithiobacillus sulfuriphilus]|uniref:type IV pilus secretin PilQ n=1 Tax=Acidithiobacillus sulfuriphilus TaxID=1867749 RepID=UPI003F619335
MSTAPCTARHVNAPRHHRVRHRMPAALRPAAMVALAALCLASAPAWAESLITGIAPVQDQHGAALLIRSTERPAYDVNTLNGGYRVQIDFTDAHFANSVGTAHGEGIIQDVLAENLAGKARLDLLLKTPQAIMIEPAPGGYRIALVAEKGAIPGTASAAAAPVATPAPPPAAVAGEASASAPTPLPAANGTSIADLGFKRGKEGGGILDLTINGSQPQMNVTREDGALVVDLKDTQLPASYAHRFNVDQFGTPVQYIDSYPRGANTRLVFAINGAFEYSAYQLGNHLLVNVHAKPVTETAAGVAAGARLSMDFQNISVRDALQVIADFTHQNIVVSNNVTGTLTIRLKNVPWEQAFKVILDSQGLAVKHIGNILWVAPASQISTQEEAELKAAASKRKLEPLVTELIPIKYARATEIAQLLQGFSQQNNSIPPGEGATYGNPAATAAQNAALAAALGIPSSTLGNSLLGSRGSVAVVTRTNSLLVRDTPQDIDNIKKLIAKIDRPVPQVLIEARIVQITTNAAQSLGVQWGGTYTSNTGSGVINLSGTGASGTTSTQGGSFPLTGSTTTTTGTTGFSVPALVNLPAPTAGTALAGVNPASLAFALGTASGSRVIDLQLQALQVANKAKIISSPKVLTADNEKAVIQQGQEIPYQQATSSGATSVSFKKAVLSLDVTPHIAPNGKITMDVSATNDQPNYAQALPSGVPINTQSVKTKLLVANGQTVVIGGIFTDTHSNFNTGIPLLKDIPGLGWLFKSRTNNIAQTELLIFLTPKVINDGAQDGSAGSETSLASGG